MNSENHSWFYVVSYTISNTEIKHRNKLIYKEINVTQWQRISWFLRHGTSRHEESQFADAKPLCYLNTRGCKAENLRMIPVIALERDIMAH